MSCVVRAAWRDQGRPEVMVYFCTRAYSPKTSDELAQWQRVLDFPRQLPKEQLWWMYKTVRRFEALLREHLTRYVLERSPASRPRFVQPTERRVRFKLPPVTTSFTGRQGEFDALDDALGVADRAMITGLGGVGKSQLAARYVQTRADDYEIVAWIRAEDGGINDLAQLAARLGQSVAGLSPANAHSSRSTG
jgi:hypothetical protein